MLKVFFFFFFFLLAEGMYKYKKVSFFSGLFFMGVFFYPMSFNPGMSLMWSDNFLFLDSLSLPLILLTFWISGLMYMCSDEPSSLFFHVVFILNGMLVSFFVSQDSLLFYVMFESALIPTLFLILKWGVQSERLQAGMYMLIYTVAASLPLLIVIIYMKKMGMGALMGLSYEEGLLFTIGQKNFLWIFICLAFLVKLPMYPLHLWLPKAHVEAPIAGSMVLAGVLLKMGGYGLLRFSFFFPLSLLSSQFFFVLGGMGGLIASLICLKEPDMKRMVAYSSVGHMGLMLSGVMTKSVMGFSASLSIMIAHGLCSSGLFALVNCTYTYSHSRLFIFNQGNMKLFPTMTMWCFIFCVYNSAAPPSLGLFSEILLFISVTMFFWGSVIFVSLLAFITATYNILFFCKTQYGRSLLLYPGCARVGDNKTLLYMMLHWVPLNLAILYLPLSSLWC